MPPARRHLRRSVVILLIASVLSGFGLAAKPVRALFGFGDVSFTTVVTDIPFTAWANLQAGLKVADTKLKDAVALAFKSAANQFLANVVQELATSLATTQPGQKPLFLTNPKTFFRDVADAAAGDFIDDFTRGITGGRWDTRCDSKDPVVRAQCQGVIGGTAGPGDATSGQRGRFIISRLLRAGVQASADVCLANCKTNYEVKETCPAQNVAKLTTIDNAQCAATKDSGMSAYTNRHEQVVGVIWGQYDYGNPAGLYDTAQTTPTKNVSCSDVVPTNGPGNAGHEWAFQLGACRAGSGNEAWCTTTAQDCMNRLQQVELDEYATSSNEAKKCRQQCQTGMGADVRGIVNQATATDVFAYVNNYDIRRTPALIANRFKGNSDISQYFQAAATLTASVQSQVTGEQTNLTAGVLPRTSKVSQKVLAPKEAASALFGIPFYNSAGQLTFTGSGVADMIRAVASFVNSPVGKALFTYFRSKCGLNPDACSGPTNTQSTIGQMLFGTGGLTGLAAARVQYAGIGQIEATTGNPGNNDIDVLGQLSVAGMIDQQFRSAIENNLTVQQAVDQGLLSRKKIVGFDKNGIEARDGYPYRALQYLRKYRIIPVGWELAARYANTFTSSDLSLGTLLDQYNICAQDTEHKVCSDSLQACKQDSECSPGQTCGASPYCGLVDPNWVLKAPQTFCRRQGAGEEIVTKEFACDLNNVRKTDGTPIKPSQQDADDPGPANCIYDAEKNPHPDIGHWIIGRNTDTCADTQSCIQEDDNGTCLAYGYCVQERQTFKFDGTSCQAQNVSCTTYTDSTNQQVSYLSKNLDTNCSADSAGCQWYCAKPSYDETKHQWTCTTSAGDKTYLTAKAQTCNAANASCRQFIRIVPGTNILPNGGFEYFDSGSLNNGPAVVNGWVARLGSLYPVTPTDPANTSGNQAAVRVDTTDANDTIAQTVDVGAGLNERTFTFSVRASAPSTCSAKLTLCTGSDCRSSGLAPSISFTPTSAWSTYSVTMSVPTADALPLNTTRITAQIQPDGCRSSGLVLDSAQLKEAAGPTDFTDYGDTNLVYLNGQRRSCAPADVGCDAYNPTAGGATVNGIISAANRCAKNDVGCQLFHREAITHVPYRDYSPAAPATGGADVTIVASTGKLCSAMDVGCEEYTNLDEVKRGGEGKAYFTSVKQCVQPTMVNKPGGPTAATFYTWIGDPEKGFVLQSQQLVSNSTGAPCTNLGLATTDGNNPSIPTCADTAQTIAAATCSAADMADNPDCTEFYDSNLNIYYRLKSKTVTVTADCHPYRNTIDETDPAYGANKNRVYYLSTKENQSCSAAAASCRLYTGNTGKVSRQIVRETFESRNIPNWVGGSWSAASPNAAGHSLRIENGKAAYTTTELIASKLVKGKSYMLTVTAAAAADSANGIARLRAFLGRERSGVPGEFDTLGGVGFQSGSGVTLGWNPAITPAGPEWHTFTLGPITIGNAVDPLWRLGLVVEGGPGYIDAVTLTEIGDQAYLIANSAQSCPATAVGCAAYRGRNGNIEYATSFARICSAEVVGCEAMIDTQNTATPFTQTTKGVTTAADRVVTLVNDPATYCPANAKACTMFGQPVFGRDNSIVSFSTVYKIADPDRAETDMCLASEDSCEAYTTTDGTTVFFKDPRSGTCEYRSGGTITGGWFITGTNTRCPVTTPPAVGQPVGNSCSPTCVGGTRDGRACTIVGSDAECPSGLCQGDSSMIGRITDAKTGKAVLGSCTIDNNGNDNCASLPAGGKNKCVYLVGTCAADQNGCTEYRDPTEPVSCRSECPLEQMGGTPVKVDANCARTYCVSNPKNKRYGQNCTSSDQCGDGGTCVGLDGTTPTVGAPGCRPYYYLRQSVQDTSGECNGQVNSAIGCRAFNDTSNPSLNFRGQ